MEKQVLPLGGRIILINSVVDALPTYVIFLFPYPHKLRRDWICWEAFFCGKATKKKGCPSCKIETLTLTTGGEGIKNLRKLESWSGCRDTQIRINHCGRRWQKKSMKKTRPGKPNLSTLFMGLAFGRPLEIFERFSVLISYSRLRVATHFI